MLQFVSSSPASSRFAPDRFHHDDGLIPGRWLAMAILFAGLVLIELMWRADLRIDPTAPGCYPFYVVGALFGGLRYGLRAPRSGLQRMVRDAAEYLGALTLMVLMGAVASYPVAAFSHGYVDAGLQRIDLALRFDWLAWYRAVAAHPWLQFLDKAAYQSIYLTPAVLIGHFAWTGRRADARGFLATFWVAATLSLVFFVFVPAVGPFAYLWHGPVPYMPESELWQPELIPALRLHALHHVDLGALRGLVSAPSFHTTAAILYIVTTWRIPRLRWPVFAVNVVMLLSTPVEGTHYLADMIAGAAVAGVALTLVARLRRAIAGQAQTASGPGFAAPLRR